jgi:hypothetical protein
MAKLRRKSGKIQKHFGFIGDAQSRIGYISPPWSTLLRVLKHQMIPGGNHPTVVPQ